MKADLVSYLRHTDRPAKRALQAALFGRIGSLLQECPTNVVDLPGIDLEGSLKRLTQAGIATDHYLAFENDPRVMGALRRKRATLRRWEGGYLCYPGARKVSLHQGDILTVLSDHLRPRTTVLNRGVDYGGGIGFFNFDFCDTVSPPARILLLLSAIDRYMAPVTAVVITYSRRRTGGRERLYYVLSEIARGLFGITLREYQPNNYRDTAPMGSDLFILERSK